ncbi:hypothetical protein ACFXA3_23740 [Streptomyces sp. NPDC059456]|uniref:hypothetical protein n=1 Tax=Streptomyces sp. NPDC059456 TaxID=3346838 RepID=UPI00367CFDDE
MVRAPEPAAGDLGLPPLLCGATLAAQAVGERFAVVPLVLSPLRPARELPGGQAPHQALPAARA